MALKLVSRGASARAGRMVCAAAHRLRRIGGASATPIFDEIFHPVARRLVGACDARAADRRPSAGADDMVATALALRQGGFRSPRRGSCGRHEIERPSDSVHERPPRRSGARARGARRAALVRDGVIADRRAASCAAAEARSHRLRRRRCSRRASSTCAPSSASRAPSIARPCAARARRRRRAASRRSSRCRHDPVIDDPGHRRFRAAPGARHGDRQHPPRRGADQGSRRAARWPRSACLQEAGAVAFTDGAHLGRQRAGDAPRADLCARFRRARSCTTSRIRTSSGRA